MFQYSCIGCDYHCSITVEKKNGKCEVSKNCCPTGAGFATAAFEKSLKNKNTKASDNPK